MKMTKKLFLVAIATTAIALTGCGMADFGDLKTKEKGNKFDKIFTVTNPGTEGEKFQRGMKQLGTKETVQTIKTNITVWTDNINGYVEATGDEAKPFKVTTDTSKTPVKGVVGLIFDWHETKVTKKQAAADGTDAGKYYDFILIGYQPEGKQYYIERYFGVPDNIFSEPSSASVWGEDALTEYITETSNAPYYYHPTDSSWVTETTDDDGNPIQQFTITIEQEVPGTYTIKLGDKDASGAEKVWSYTIPEDEQNGEGASALIKKLWDKDGYRQGGAGYYVNCPLGLTVKGNFDTDRTATKGLFEEVDE